MQNIIKKVWSFYKNIVVIIVTILLILFFLFGGHISININNIF